MFLLLACWSRNIASGLERPSTFLAASSSISHNQQDNVRMTTCADAKRSKYLLGALLGLIAVSSRRAFVILFNQTAFKY